MKVLSCVSLLALSVAFITATHHAQARSTVCNELAYFGAAGLDTLSPGAVTTGDLDVVCDASTGKMKKVDATARTFSTLTVGTLTSTTINNSGVITETRTPTADSATINSGIVSAMTTPVDTTGTNTHFAVNIPLTIGNATGGTNEARAINIPTVTGDAEVNVTGIRINNGTTLGTSRAMVIGSGWDKELDLTHAAAADSGTSAFGFDLNLNTPVDTTGTNTHTGLNIDLTVANATGGTNTANGITFSNYTGDAQMNVNAINIGTSDGLGTANAIAIGTGWDAGITVGSPVTGSGLTTVSNMVGFTRAIQTQQATLTAAMCGSVVTNSGAVVSTLPEASTVLGCQFHFITGNASNFDINPFDGTDTISLLTNAAGDAVRNATVGNSLCLIAVSNDLWHQCSAPVGTWTDVN